MNSPSSTQASQLEGSKPPLTRSLVGAALVGIVLLLMHLAAPVLTPVMPAFSWLQ